MKNTWTIQQKNIWTGLQADWDLHQAKQEKGQKAIDASAFIDRFQIKELKARGVLPKTTDVVELCDDLLKFFRIGLGSSIN